MLTLGPEPPGERREPCLRWTPRGYAEHAPRLVVPRLYSLVMKIAVSVPDDVFERAELLARERNVSRSELYTEALRKLVMSDERVTEQLDQIYSATAGRGTDLEGDDAVDAASRRLLADADW